MWVGTPQALVRWPWHTLTLSCRLLPPPLPSACLLWVQALPILRSVNFSFSDLGQGAGWGVSSLDLYCGSCLSGPLDLLSLSASEQACGLTGLSVSSWACFSKSLSLSLLLSVYEWGDVHTWVSSSQSLSVYRSVS